MASESLRTAPPPAQTLNPPPLDATPSQGYYVQTARAERKAAALPEDTRTTDEPAHRAADVTHDVPSREADVESPRPQVVRRGGTFESFRHRDYTLFWSGALVSNVGTWMQNYALAIVVWTFRRNELDLGIVNFLTGVPVLFLALWAGSLADRVDRRRLIIWAQVVLMVQAAILAVLFGTGRLSSAHALEGLAWVAVLSLLAGVLAALSFPSWQSILPDLVPKEELLNAIALNSAQFQSARLLGPLAAGALVLAGASMGDIFWVNSVSFLFVIAALLAVRPRPSPRHVPSEHESSWETLTAGLRYAREHRTTGVLILTTAVLTIFGMPYMMLIAAIADKALGFGGAQLGKTVSYLMAANGLGAVAGALIVASLPKTVRRENLVRFSLTALAVLLIAFSLSRWLSLSLVLSALAGAAVLTTNSLTNTSIQATVPPQLRGRVVALFIISFLGMMPFSAIVFGAIGTVIGPANAVLVGAVVLLAYALLLFARPSLLLGEDTA